MQDNKQRYLVIERGRTLKQYFRIKNPITGAVYNLKSEGYNKAVLEVRNRTLPDGGSSLMRLTTENGGISLDYIANDGTGNSWSGYIYSEPGATMLDHPLRDAIFDFVAIHDGGSVDTISRGPVLLIPDVSAV